MSETSASLTRGQRQATTLVAIPLASVAMALVIPWGVGLWALSDGDTDGLGVWMNLPVMVFIGVFNTVGLAFGVPLLVLWGRWRGRQSVWSAMGCGLACLVALFLAVDASATWVHLFTRDGGVWFWWGCGALSGGLYYGVRQGLRRAWLGLPAP